jgi:hypothetical protein
MNRPSAAWAPRLASALAAFLVAAPMAAAQPAATPRVSAAADLEPAAPVAPEVVSRSVSGRTIVRATRLMTPLRVDGRLDEEVYATVKSVSGLIQSVPNQGQPSTELTEAWIMFDDDFFYLAGRMHESVPPNQWVANELRRDTSQLRNNDLFGVLLDTFNDKRNGFHFYVNPLGGFADQIITDEGNPNADWNPVWQVRTARFDGGWTAEFAIPFKSIRYDAGSNQTWGIQLRRSIRRKNEWTHLTALPPIGGGSNSIFRVSAAATLVGLDLPATNARVELKPYVIGRATTAVTTPNGERQFENDLAGDYGLDAKYGVTANLNADITMRTDFAQVEVDEQQVNLTRFSIQFPEKRDFFLEGRGIYDFGRTAGGPGNGNATPVNQTPTLFYSRRIGLNTVRGQQVIIPIDVGGRLTGKVGDWSVGLLNLETRAEAASNSPKTNFTVGRLKRDILKRSYVGAMVTNRSESFAVPGGSNLAYGADAFFSLFQDVTLVGYWARSMTEGREEDRDSYQARAEYAADRWGAKLEYLKVGDNFDPEIGFVRRRNVGRTFSTFRFSPRTSGRKRVRRYNMEGTFEYLRNGVGQTESRQESARFSAEFQSSDVFQAQLHRSYELLVNPFNVFPGVSIPRGDYTFSDANVSYQFGQQRRMSGTASFQVGHYYNGDITAVGFSGGRIAILKQWSAEPSLSLNRVTGVEDGGASPRDFTSTVVRLRSDYGFTARMFASSLVQWNSADNVLSSNFRFRWEYKLGSELFVVYTDERDSLNRTGYPDLKNRAFVVKFNRFVRF